ncbi:MAG: DUF192 domain-containing protein [Beijerinckiaceae bacterium]|mgnify:CR=1 FL=1
MIRTLHLALVALVIAAAAPACADAQLEKLAFVTKSGVHEFKVEVMRTPAEFAKGLMFRRYMPADRGMLFDFNRDEVVNMWMKNTYIPLDMVFVGKDGRVFSIAADTEPLSERTISSGGPVTGVVELNAGAAAKMGLSPGDEVRHPMFRR